MHKTHEFTNFSYIHELSYQLKVKDAMSSEVVTVSPQNTMRDVRNILREKRISGLPVTVGTKLVGIISVEDIIRAMDDNEIDSPVEKRMTHPVRSLDANYPLIKALMIFEEYSYGRFPVVDKEENLLGILTSGDITRRILFELNRLSDDIAAREAAQMAKQYAFGNETDQFILEAHLKAGDFENAGIFSNQLKQRLQQIGIIPEIIRRASIVSYESETNIIIHSIGGTIKAEIHNNKIIIEAKDTGPGIADIELALQPGYSTASDQVRALGFGAGMGLPNIKRSADVFHIDSQVGRGTTLTVEIELKTAEVAPRLAATQ